MDESDRKKLDRIDAYVRDQVESENSWYSVAEKFGVWLALAAFLFGIGNFADVGHFWQNHESAQAKSKYVAGADIGCRISINSAAAAISVVNGGTLTAKAENGQKILDIRGRMPSLLREGSNTLSDEDKVALGVIFSRYRAADEFLAAAIDRAKANDTTGFLVDIGLYNEANSDFAEQATSFGFAQCNYPIG